MISLTAWGWLTYHNPGITIRKAIKLGEVIHLKNTD
jgi:hypothetical protein